LIPPRCLGGVHIGNRFNFMCCVCFFLVYVLCLVLRVALVCGLFILDCLFGFLLCLAYPEGDSTVILDLRYFLV